MTTAAAGGFGSPARGVVRLTLYVVLTAVSAVTQIAILAARLPLRQRFPRWYHRQCCRIFGIRIERRGRQSRTSPTLYVANHASYLDVTVLGALISGSFVAKAEVAGWPALGWLARLQGTVFVERRPTRSADHRDTLVERLAGGDDLVLFPEGTSSDGNRVLPFRSALFSVAERWPGPGPLTIQPVSITYTRLDGLPLGRALRPFFAWYGDMDLVPHLWHLAGLGRPTVVVRFHRPASLEEFGTRKALARYCEDEVALGVAEALSGHAQEVVPARARAA